MESNYTAESYLNQLLKVIPSTGAISPMFPVDENQAFSERLNALLDARGFVAKNHGRQKELAKKFGLVQQSVGKWINGDGMPKTTLLIQLARDFQCNFEWLALGTGPRDADPSLYGPQAELARRLAAAPPETARLVELALMSDADLEKTGLPASLTGLVGFLKQQIREASGAAPDLSASPTAQRLMASTATVESSALPRHTFTK